MEEDKSDIKNAKIKLIFGNNSAFELLKQKEDAVFELQKKEEFKINSQFTAKKITSAEKEQQLDILSHKINSKIRDINKKKLFLSGWLQLAE